MADTPTFDEPTGSADERLANLKTLENGEAAKAADQPFYENINYGMMGADVGVTTVGAVDGVVAAAASTGTAVSGWAVGAAVATALAPAAIAVGGAWLLDKVGVTGAMAKGFVWVGDELGLTIGHGDPHPACVGDDIAHSMGFWGIAAGIAAGIVVGALVVAAVVVTGGTAGPLIVGACMAGGLSLGSALASASQSFGSNCGKIASGSDNVYFEGRKVARVTDLVKCEHHSGTPQPLVEGSKTIFVNGLPLVRIGHETHCSGKINDGRKSIWIDKTTAQYGPKNPELTAGEEFWAGMLGALVGGAFAHGIIDGARSKSTESAETGGVKDDTRPKCEDPVDPVSGEVLEVRTDIAIPGVLPLELKRRYRTRSEDAGLLGPRWSDNWSQRLEFSEGRLVRFHDGAGLVTGFDAPVMALDGINLREPRYRLVGSRLDPRILDRDTRQLHIFAPLAEGRPSRLERIEDLDGNSIAFAYDAKGRLVELTHSDGYRLAVQYHASIRTPERIVLHEVDGASRTLVDYGYSEGMLADVASFQFGQFHYTYDAHGWMTGWRDSDQTDVRYLYDHAGRVVETGTKQGYHTGRFVYGDGWTGVINADGEWLYEYNGEGFTTAETDPLGHRTVREWEMGRLMSQTDALGRHTAYRYDERGQLVAVRETSGRTTGFEYDDQQRLAAVVLSGGARVQFEYDHLRRLIARTELGGRKTGYRYGNRGELLRISEGDRETRFGYDERLRLNEIRLPTGATIRRMVDVLGRVLEETDPGGQTTRYDYVDGPDNPRGAVKTVSRPDGTSSRVSYNREGLPVKWVDPLGRSTSRSYGPFDLLTASTDAAGHATHFEYDHATRLTKVINALAETYEYRYDGAGRLAQEIDWGGRVTRYERDAVGRLLMKSLPDGGHWHFSYDALDRLSALDAGDVKLIYRYDARGRLASAEVQDNISDSPHVTRFAYDMKGHLIGEDQHGELLRHVYDAQGQCSLRVTPHRETQYAYDALGELTQVGPLSILRDALGRQTGRQTGEFVAQQQYDVLGRIQRQIAGPGTALEALQSDPARALQQLTRQVYHYDAAGELERLETDADTTSYSRDVRGQVTSVERPTQPAEHYRYDAAMNIAAHGQQAAVDAHQYRHGGLPERIGHAHYSYDGRGRTIEKTVEQPGFRPKTWQYSWDGLNRLVKVVTPERGVWTYRYDAFNRRVEKRQAGAREAVKFLWDGYVLAERWIEKRDGTTGQAITWHIEHGSFTPLAQETDKGLYAVLTDQVGLPKALFNDRGERIWQAAHTLWGSLIPSRPSRKPERAAANDDCDSLDTTLRFPGQWADDESGLHYNLNRFFDPDSGQYLSSDPIGLEGGFRTQAYVSDPLQWCDPLGLSGCDKGLSGRGVRPGPGERSLTKEQYRELMSRYRNQGDALQAALDEKISSQSYVYRATTWKAVENYRKQGSISGYKGAPTYMSTDYVGTDPAVLMDRGQVFPQWGAPEVLLKIPTPMVDVANVPRPLGNQLSTGWEPNTEFYPAAGSGGQNQFLGTTKAWSDDWIIPVDQN